MYWQTVGGVENGTSSNVLFDLSGVSLTATAVVEHQRVRTHRTYECQIGAVSAKALVSGWCRYYRRYGVGIVDYPEGVGFA